MAKEIILRSLKLKNFKGIKDINIDFHKTTNIYGENAAGKTTIFDAFTWLLFDKDSQDRANFEIKTLDSTGEPIHGQDHEVEGVLYISGKVLMLGKVFREKWTKKRGDAEKQFTGHETLYYIDEVPVKKSEFQDTIKGIIDESIFKFITNPLYFSTNLKWQDRRKVLMDIIGDISIENVINYKNDLRPLERLLGGKDIDAFKRSISARRKKLNDDIKAIPFRIDELSNSIQDLDFDALEFQRRFIIGSMKQLEDRMLDSSKANDEILKKKEEIYKLKGELQRLKYQIEADRDKPKRELETKILKLENELHRENMGLENIKNNISIYASNIEEIEKTINNLREKWHATNTEELIINEDDFMCPTCKRLFEADDIEAKKQEMQENFNLDKAKKLVSIRQDGKENADKLKNEKELLAKLENDKADRAEYINILNDRLNRLKEELSSYTVNLNIEDVPEYKEIKAQIETLESEIVQPAAGNELMNLRDKKSELQRELDEINKKLALKDQNEKFRARIQELIQEEKELAQQIAKLEGQEYLCEEFIKTKVELLESSINSKFKYVSFKLFETQVNGGLNETCEALIKGVPYSNANSASQINAGLDIINALSQYYEVQAPIFIDNRESVNELIDTEAQIINLIVSKDKNLRVEGM